MLILILVDAQYSQKAVLALKKFQMVEINPAQVPTTHYK